MKLRKILLTFLAGSLFVACSDSDNNVDTGIVEGADTYVNLSINLAQGKTTRALPEDYNEDGEYEGLDGINTLDIYMVAQDGTLEAKRFTTRDLATTGVTVTLGQPYRTTSGNKTIYVVVNSPSDLAMTAPKATDLLDITGLASLVTLEDNTVWDVITMTGQTSTTVYVQPDITQQAATAGINNFSVDVTRLASRAIVTTTASNILTDTDGTQVGTLSNVTYSVAQGTNKVYWAATADYTTWGSSYVTAMGNYTTTATQYYDYSDLSTPSAVPAKPAGDDYKSLKGKFLFENTHTAGDVKTSGYKKGNTAYILVKAIFTPETAAIADGGTLMNGTFYVGESDGRIYSTKQAAQTAVANQRVSEYANGKVLYYAWLNPDVPTKPLNSPVLRNNIYHVNITGFGKIGLNWNPLYPEDPDTPNPNNPDPKPENPDEPETPIDPIDPLTPQETYMSVDVNVLSWKVHSYDIEL